MLKKSFLVSSKGQGLVENLIVTMLFLNAVIFVIIQISLITINNLIANEAAFSAARAAIVSPTYAEAKDIINVVSGVLLAPHFSPNNFIPIKTSVWRKQPLGVDNKDYGDGKNRENIWSYTINVKHATRVMFGSVMQPILGDLDPFIITEGKVGSFYSKLYLPYTLPTNARCRLVKSPDREFLYKAFPDAPNW